MTKIAIPTVVVGKSDADNRIHPSWQLLAREAVKCYAAAYEG